ncbi:MAG: HAMP domain-containing sensor histidine kinase [Kofleriaceae bacterium]
MRLTARFLIAFVLILALALGVTTWRAVDRASAQFDRDLRRDTALVGAVVAKDLEAAMRAGDAAAQQAAVVTANRAHTGFAVRRVAFAAAPAAVQDRLAHGLPAAIRVGDRGDDGLLATYVPLSAVAGQQAIEVTASLGPERRYLRATARSALVFSLVALAMAVAAASILGVVFIARPTRALIAKTARVGRGDFTAPVTVGSNDEFGDLARAINDMTDALAAADERAGRENEARLQAVEQLRHADRLMTVGRLSAGIAHELGTPLNVIEGRAKMIQRGEVVDAEAIDSARIVVEQSQRITRIVRQLLDFARRGEPSIGQVDLGAIADEATRMLASTAQKAGVELAVAPPEAPITVAGDGGQLLQVVTNLVVNAIHATPARGRVTIEVTTATGPHPGHPGAGRCAVLAVRDTGAGMEPATRDRVFEPFFTTKEVGQGTGLGLSVVHGIVTDHHGWVDVESEVAHGSCFRVYLPCPCPTAS